MDDAVFEISLLLHIRLVLLQLLLFPHSRPAGMHAVSVSVLIPLLLLRERPAATAHGPRPGSFPLFLFTVAVRGAAAAAAVVRGCRGGARPLVVKVTFVDRDGLQGTRGSIRARLRGQLLKAFAEVLNHRPTQT